MLCAFVLLSGCYGQWTTRDYTMLAANAACAATDYRQTSYALDHGYHEANPLIGTNPSDKKMASIKGVGFVLTWDIAEAAGTDKYKWLTAAVVPCSAAIIHNAAIGAKGL